MKIKVNKFISAIILVFILIVGFIVVNVQLILPRMDYNLILSHGISYSPDGRYELEFQTMQLVGDSDIDNYTNDEAYEVLEERAFLVLYDVNQQQYKEIYYGKEPVTRDEIKWVDEQTLQIKNHILKLPYEVYDYRIHVWK